MSNITLAPNAAGAATFTLAAPGTDTNRTINLPDASTTLVGTDAAQTLSNKTIQGGTIQSGTAQASISGTSIDFTGIPSWAKRVTVLMNGVSTNGTSPIQLQVGSGSISVTGYVSAAAAINGGTGQTSSATGLPLTITLTAASTQTGKATLELIGSNTWVEAGLVLYTASAGAMVMSAGSSPALSGALDRVRITTISGTDTFDAGTINIMWEG